MKAFIVKKIELEEVEVPDGQLELKVKKIVAPHFARTKTDGLPAEVVDISEEESYELHRVRFWFESPQHYYVKRNEQGVFGEMVRISLESIEKEVQNRVQEAVDKFYTEDLQLIKRSERIEAEARVARLPFAKKMQLLFHL